ncbi:MAG: hypothetical protein Q9208_000426 [Pyrenodesmia sp. 3 TL-2023]
MSEHESDLFKKPFLTRTAIILLHVLGLGPEIKKGPKDASPRTMQVLVLGLGRCGTSSRYREALREALKILDYRPYDSPDRFLTNHDPLWGQALRAKYYNQGKKWGRADFDKVTAGYDVSTCNTYTILYITSHTCAQWERQAILDTPCCFFAEELTTAYPDALVILNTRAVDSWLHSMRSTIFAVHAWPSWKILQYIDPKVTGMWYPNRRLEWKIFCNHDYGEPCRQAFLKHYEHVRAVVPKERLLEYDLGSGWEPLCRFLGKEVPDGEFPRVNDADGFMMRQGWLWWYGVFMALVNVVKIGVPVAVAVAAWSWYKKLQS